jgi:hypothetical protein
MVTGRPNQVLEFALGSRNSRTWLKGKPGSSAFALGGSDAGRHADAKGARDDFEGRRCRPDLLAVELDR